MDDMKSRADIKRGVDMRIVGTKRPPKQSHLKQMPLKQRLLKPKKAVSTWISWVLLVTFVIFIGTTIFYWMKDYSTDAMTLLENRLKTTEKCDLVGIQISELTSKNAQTLNMKVTNRYNLGIDRIVFTLYDSKNRFIWLNISNTTIKPNSTKEIEIPQNSSMITARIEAVPVILDDGNQIYCTERKVDLNVTV